MAAAGADPGSEPAGGAQFFCTAGRGLEPFLMREVRARLEATQVEYISGKVFFTTCSDLPSMKKLKSAERLFLLIKKQLPITVSSLHRGRLLNEMQRFINDDPGSWLKAISLWRKLLDHDTNGEKVSQGDANPLKRKAGENDSITPKKLKLEEMQVVDKSHGESQQDQPQGPLEQGETLARTDELQEQRLHRASETAAHAQSPEDLTFRISCRCSGSIRKVVTGQEAGRVAGLALMRQFGWKADLRKPDLEAGALVLDPMCGLGTILVEAAEEWPDVFYVGADVSDSQLLGACDNLKAAGLAHRIELLKGSVADLPLPAQSVDVIISDIPFGKKFKLGKDIKSILQEMERWPLWRKGTEYPAGEGDHPGCAVGIVKRCLPTEVAAEGVLHVDGVMILLLSEDHHRRLTDCGGSSMPPTSQGNVSDPEMKMLLNPDRTGAPDTASPSQKASSLQSLGRPLPCGSLVPVESFKVSLGKTDAFICKYKKASASGLSPSRCHEPGAHPEVAAMQGSPGLQDSICPGAPSAQPLPVGMAKNTAVR
ncbi:THUMP domain-containing protein 2 isoform X1 [Rattus norvegicus]|uniref:THUMP domain-containing protein 2 isoform X1 n=1 Tax=Rattus norvegicus TaxID=10116 RepID=UPI0003D0891E|nr:THUMP domain-containing protein 2 isoform X2 [Rattus norvegicus]|eukprot:XP_006239735.1 PREDICTED: THUMP domain-containing protein 2 isoform X2 [Rattus norvegicus]